MNTRNAWLPAIVLMACAGCVPTQPIAAPAPGAWLIFLCQASDAPTEPNTVGFYQELFDRNQRGLLFDYFQKSSNFKLDLSRSDVFGWFPMTVATAALSPTVRNKFTIPSRIQTVRDCKQAGVTALLTSGRTIDPDKYAGFIAVINVAVDAGEAGLKGVVANANDPSSFYEHEMLHTFGLHHAHIMSPDASSDHSWDSGTDQDLGDCWDIMTFANCAFTFDPGFHGVNGPELQLASREKLGWLPAGAVHTVDAADPTPVTLTLSPVSQPTGPVPLMAKVVLSSGAKYVVEYRIPTGFDRDLLANAVVIRELRANDETFLVQRQDTRIDWVGGDTFTDAGNYLSISVLAMTPLSATITIDPRFAMPALIGQRCGDKYVGEVRACPAGHPCDANRTPATPGTAGTMTTEYFCQ